MLPPMGSYSVCIEKKMAAVSRAIFIVAAKRTPFGAFGGKLKSLTATEMGAVASVAALKSGGIDPQWVQSVIFGSVGHVRTFVAV